MCAIAFGIKTKVVGGGHIWDTWGGGVVGINGFKVEIPYKQVCGVGWGRWIKFIIFVNFVKIFIGIEFCKKLLSTLNLSK